MCNSGSSANLLALAALELPRGSEVITCAVAFPTTVNPIVQLGLIPVFVDCEPGTWNIDTTRLEKALSSKTGAVMFAHTLGNPANTEAMSEFCKPRGLWLIEDCCDAAGAFYKQNRVGEWGDLSTYSFYPAHQITTGEGGAVLTDNPKLAKIVASYREWGRACWCAPGCDNTCGKRFAGDYDHKYTYDRIGWNLKATDPQAEVGLDQLRLLDTYVRARLFNWNYLRAGLADLPLVFSIPQLNSDPSWFGFAFGVERRNELARFLDERRIGNRPLFAGNITRQPAYDKVNYRVSGSLNVADFVHEHLIWVGCWQGLCKEQLDYVISSLHDFFSRVGA